MVSRCRKREEKKKKKEEEEEKKCKAESFGGGGEESRSALCEGLIQAVGRAWGQLKSICSAALLLHL